jgi:hypothetical protein
MVHQSPQTQLDSKPLKQLLQQAQRSLLRWELGC